MAARVEAAVEAMEIEVEVVTFHQKLDGRIQPPASALRGTIIHLQTMAILQLNQ